MSPSIMTALVPATGTRSATLRWSSTRSSVKSVRSMVCEAIVNSPTW